MTTNAPRDRIVGFETVRAGDLKPDPRNWRIHGAMQRTMLERILERVGNVSAIIARRTVDDELVIVDGHLRAGLDADAEIPVLIVDLNEAEAGEALATLDPLAGLAVPDGGARDSLLAVVTLEDDSMKDMVRALHGFTPVELGARDISANDIDLAQQGITDIVEAEPDIVMATCPACGNVFEVLNG